jgi:uncharacterized protein YdaU (DUF1376 family)
VSSRAAKAELQAAYKPDWMRWFPKHFWGEFWVQRMPRLARYFYRNLLDQEWMSEHPPYLPLEDGVLWQLADAESLEEWKQYKDVVLQRFEKTGDGKFIYHHKMLGEYQRACKEHDDRAAGGRSKGPRKPFNSAPAQHKLSSSSARAEHPAELGKEVEGDKEREGDTTGAALTPDMVATKACEQLGLTGIFWLRDLTDIVTKAAKLWKLEPEAAGERLVQDWKSYQESDEQFKVGVEKFFKNGIWMKDKPKAGGLLPPGFVPTSERIKRGLQ